MVSLTFIVARRVGQKSEIGDWAGNSYASTDCPGTCEERLTEPANFVVSSRSSHGATWFDLLDAECHMEHQLPKGLSQADPEWAHNERFPNTPGNNVDDVSIIPFHCY